MNSTFLDKILAVKRDRVYRQKGETDIAALKKQAVFARAGIQNNRLSTALRRTDRINIIAEIKRASPSKGLINDTIDVADTARLYCEGGAAAISVLTEEDFFKGSLGDLVEVRRAVDIPVLRKDFIVDEFQIHESAAAGADAVLLIVAALNDIDLANFLALVHDHGMDAIVEVHTAVELEIAANIGANIIGVNNRNLSTFDVSLDVSRSLIHRRPETALMIAESGISARYEIDDLKTLGFDGFLIGETLMLGAELKEFSQEGTAR